MFLGKLYQYFYAISSDVDAENPGTVSAKLISLNHNDTIARSSLLKLM